MRRPGYAYLCYFFFLAVFSLPCPVNADVSLIFGLYTSDKPTVIIKKFRPIATYLESALHKKLNEPVRIKIQVASNYEKGIRSLEKGEVGFARFGPASYVEVKDRDPGVRIIAIESKKGSKRFKGIICVHKDSPINFIQDLKGKRFAFGNPLSTIGRYLSQQYLLENGIRAADLSSYDYLGRHDKVGHAVGIGQYDAGALKENTFKKLVKKGVPLRTLAEFQNVTKPWIARSGLNDKTFFALQESLLELKDKTVLKALKKDGFVTGSDEDYSMIRKSIRKNHAFFETL